MRAFSTFPFPPDHSSILHGLMLMYMSSKYINNYIISPYNYNTHLARPLIVTVVRVKPYNFSFQTTTAVFVLFQQFKKKCYCNQYELSTRKFPKIISIILSNSHPCWILPQPHMIGIVTRVILVSKPNSRISVK